MEHISIRDSGAVIYVGASGILNTGLQSKLISKNTALSIFSARETVDSNLVPNLKNCFAVIYGGRDLSDEWKKILINFPQDVIFIYLSTYRGNRFCDAYQLNKKLEYEAILGYHQNSFALNIPFIREHLPINAQKILKKGRKSSSNFYLSLVDLDQISCCVIDILGSKKVQLDPVREKVILGHRERALWFFYSKIYSFGNKFNSKKILYSIKILEKLSHFVLRTSGLSCVFIQKELVK